MVMSHRTRERLQTGVYCWRNKVNGKVYVGSTTRSFHQRMAQHLSKLRRGISAHKHLQAAWNKYGESAFEWVILWKCLPSECVEREQEWIDKLQAANRDYGYNALPIAGNTCEAMAARAGMVKMTDEAKAKISAAARRQWADPQMRERMVAAMTAKLAEPEVRRKISKGITGRKLSEESKQKMAARKRASWADPEYRRRMIEVHKGRVESAETRAKKSAAMRAHHARRREEHLP
jgi:group I intron endonuclease